MYSSFNLHTHIYIYIYMYILLFLSLWSFGFIHLHLLSPCISNSLWAPLSLGKQLGKHASPPLLCRPCPLFSSRRACFTTTAVKLQNNCWTWVTMAIQRQNPGMFVIYRLCLILFKKMWKPDFFPSTFPSVELAGWFTALQLHCSHSAFYICLNVLVCVFASRQWEKRVAPYDYNWEAGNCDHSPCQGHWDCCARQQA